MIDSSADETAADPVVKITETATVVSRCAVCAAAVQPNRLAKLAVLLLLPFTAHAAGTGHSHAESTSQTANQTERQIEKPQDPTIRFLTERIAKDPLEFSSKNRLAAIYLRRLHRDGNHADLHRARDLARSSLDDFPASSNSDALSVLAQAEFAAHEFQTAAQLARQLIQIKPRDVGPQLILGDALLELGAYDDATVTYRAAQQNVSVRSAGVTVSIEARLGKLAWLRGNTAAARHHLNTALAAALTLPAGNEDRVAWCQWQIGEMAFAQGDLADAERMQQQALQSVQHYARAIAALARIRAAQGNRDEAIRLYSRAIELSPHIRFLAALGDLYSLAGHHERAGALYRRAERIGFDLDDSGEHDEGDTGPAIPESIANESQWPDHYGRDLALFYADRGLKPGLALEIALHEYERRQDIYTADALAWTALKAGNLELVASTIQHALRLGTEDAQLYYHAGMIAHASGDASQARHWLQRALALNRHFDARQSPVAQQLMMRLGAPCPTCPTHRSSSHPGAQANTPVLR